MSVRVSRSLVGVLTLLTIAPSAWAHDGHGSPQWFGSAVHYLFEPMHLPLALGALALLIVTVRKARAEKRSG